MSSSSLHRHALESIFAFAPLSELSSLMCVSRSWQSAVLSMRPLDTPFTLTSRIKAAPDVFESRLVRHLVSLSLSEPPNAHVFDPSMFLSAPRLEGFSRHATHLTSFTCVLASNLPTTIHFPSKLTSLRIALASNAGISDCDTALNAISTLTCLSSLHLTLAEPLHTVRFHSLARLGSLRSLQLVFLNAAKPLSAVQEDDLRALAQLTSLDFQAFDEAAFWRMLRPGHKLQLTTLDARFGLIESCTASLASLPSLTQLRCRLQSASSWSCINVLPNLSRLIISFMNANQRQLAAPDMDALRPCPSLQHLVFYGNRCEQLTVSYLSRMLANMPELRILTLFAVPNLLAVPLLPPLLTKLDLECAADFDAVRAAMAPLIHLQELGIYGSTANWTADQHGTFDPPCALLPELIKFKCWAP